MFAIALGFIGRNRKLFIILGGIVVALIVVAVVLHNAKEAGRAEVEAENAAAVAETKAKGAAGREASAEQRTDDAAAVAAQHEERSIANRKIPDARPSDRTISRRCVQLRQQGRDTSRIPECAGR